MSSPFSQEYMDKSPIAELNNLQKKKLPIELQNAINAKEGNEAKDASPASQYANDAQRMAAHASMAEQKGK